MFEVTVGREGWEREEWARITVPFLTGEAQRAYYSLQTPHSKCYPGKKSSYEWDCLQFVQTSSFMAGRMTSKQPSLLTSGS